MLSRGSPLTPARIPPFQLPTHGQRPRSTSQGLQPSDGGPALLHVPTVTTAHGFQVLAQRPQALSAEAPLWQTSPETPADPSWILDQPEIPGTPPHGRFQNLSKMDRILTLLTTRKLRSREVDQHVLGHRAGVLAQGVGFLQHHLPPTPILCSEAHHVGAESLPPPAPGALTPPQSTSDTTEPCSPPRTIQVRLATPRFLASDAGEDSNSTST